MRGREGWARPGRSISHDGVGVGGIPFQAYPAKGLPLGRRRLHPGNARSLDRSLPGGARPEPRSQSCCRPGSRRAAPNFAASSAGRSPLTPPARSRLPDAPLARSSRAPTRGASRGSRYPNEGAVPGTKSRSLPSRRLTPAPPRQKSYRSPAAPGARRGSLCRTHQSGFPSSTYGTSTCLACSDSDGGCSAFSRVAAPPALLLPSRTEFSEPSSPPLED